MLIAAREEVLAKTDKFEMTMEREPTRVTLRLSGVIDEDTNLSTVLDNVRRMIDSLSEIHFDLAGVTRINSCGVREWLLLMERLPLKLQKVFLSVSEFFVEQTNMVPNMLGGKSSKILAFEAPYHCTACKEDFQVVLAPSQVTFRGESPVPPKIMCQRCGGTMDFAWLPDEYLAFVKRMG